MTTEQQEKRYDPSDITLKFVERKDDITLDDDPENPRAEMSCGHAVTPQSLTWCLNSALEVLRTCSDITFMEVQGVTGCPSIRACPTCGDKVEHDKKGCKNIICPRCQIEFCFVSEAHS